MTPSRDRIPYHAQVEELLTLPHGKQQGRAAPPGYMGVAAWQRGRAESPTNSSVHSTDQSTDQSMHSVEPPS